MTRSIMRRIIQLLASSDQWGGFVGFASDTKRIDELILKGDLSDAANHLRYVTNDVLDAHLETAAIEARRDYLRGKQ